WQSKIKNLKSKILLTVSLRLTPSPARAGAKELLIYPNTAETRERAAGAVAAGRVIAFRTDTFYGLGADPFDPAALLRLNELKGRDGKPVLVVVSDPEAADRLVSERTPAFELLSARHWPGPLTLVAAAREGTPELLTAGTGTVGVRLPDDADARELVRACGGALTATSANPAGRPPARTATEAAAYFPRGLELIVEGGPARIESPSTVLDVTGARPRLIREGAVTRGQLEESLRGTGISLVE
ncbi:MAG TPA: L-threonylcarbamoyladenylate synthase, partial [Pyrinomonadaceae bacterium]|nr:L-threonylcarbamoyladenylate synthase [Pyrinomonadaceae bacterium]